MHCAEFPFDRTRLLVVGRDGVGSDFSSFDESTQEATQQQVLGHSARQSGMNEVSEESGGLG